MSYALSRIDRKIARHIRLNGKILDQVGKELTVQFVNEALKNLAIKEAANRYEFTLENLCMMYAAMVECVMPNPLVKDPSGLAPMMCASLQFMEPFRIENLMGTIHRKAKNANSETERNELIVSESEILSSMTWHSHAKNRGEVDFHITPMGTGSPTSGGCGCLVIIGFFTLASLGALFSNLNS